MAAASEDSARALADGRDALARGAWEEARAAFQHALAAGETPEALEGLALGTLWLDEERVTLESLERAYTLYRQGDDRLGAARTALWLGLCSVYLRGQPAVASGWLGRAERLLEGLEPASEHALLSAWQAHFALLGDHDLEGARRLARRAVDLARGVGDHEVETHARALEGLVLVSSGEVAEGMRRLDEATAAALSGELVTWHAISNVCCYLIYACKRVRDYGRAAEWCDRARELSERWGDRFTFAACRTQYADILIVRGSWAEADAEIAANVRELDSFSPARAVDGLVRLAELRRRQGRFDEAAAQAAEAEAHPRSLLVRSALALDLGRPGEAADLADRYLRRIPVDEPTERVDGLELLVQAAAATGDLERARSVVAELARVAELVTTPPLRAAAAQAAGLLAGAAGDSELARRSFEDAADLYVASGAPFEAARARLALAGALRDTGREPAARQEARTALDALLDLGASHEGERAAVLARELGAGVPSVVSDPAGLTAREREVIALIAAGASNADIAAELVLSVRTVERHVANIYDKVGAAGKAARATATAYAFRHDLA
jgi:ATP/maltotriose-dependent transcriptional regulator MalT